MTMLEFKVFPRDKKGRPRQRRRAGFVPGIIYGHNVKNLLIEVPHKILETAYREAGESTFLTLKIDNDPLRKVLIHDVQFHPLTHKIEHVDFYQIKSDEKIILELELNLIGAAPVVHEKGGILVVQLNKLKIECLPDDLVHKIDVDVSVLRDIHQMIRVKDLRLPAKIRVLNNPEEVVAVIDAPRVEEEIKKAEEQPVVAVGEQIPTEQLVEEKQPDKTTSEKNREII